MIGPKIDPLVTPDIKTCKELRMSSILALCLFFLSRKTYLFPHLSHRHKALLLKSHVDYNEKFFDRSINTVPIWRFSSSGIF